MALDSKIANMLALIHSENIFLASLISGFYSKVYVDENIIPTIEDYQRIYRDILEVENYNEETLTS